MKGGKSSNFYDRVTANEKRLTNVHNRCTGFLASWSEQWDYKLFSLCLSCFDGSMNMFYVCVFFSKLGGSERKFSPHITSKFSISL